MPSKKEGRRHACGRRREQTEEYTFHVATLYFIRLQMAKIIKITGKDLKKKTKKTMGSDSLFFFFLGKGKTIILEEA